MQQQPPYNYGPQHGPNNGGNPGGQPRGPAHRSPFPHNPAGGNGMGQGAHNALRMPAPNNSMTMTQGQAGSMPFSMFPQSPRPMFPFLIQGNVNGTVWCYQGFNAILGGASRLLGGEGDVCPSGNALSHGAQISSHPEGHHPREKLRSETWQPDQPCADSAYQVANSGQGGQLAHGHAKAGECLAVSPALNQGAREGRREHSRRGTELATDDEGGDTAAADADPAADGVARWIHVELSGAAKKELEELKDNRPTRSSKDQYSRYPPPIISHVVQSDRNEHHDYLKMGHNQRIVQSEHYGGPMTQYMPGPGMYPPHQPQFTIPPPAHTNNQMHPQSRPHVANPGVPTGLPTHSSAPASISMQQQLQAHHLNSVAIANASVGSGVVVSPAMAGPHQLTNIPGGNHQPQPLPPQSGSMNFMGGPNPSPPVAVAPAVRERKVLAIVNPDTGKPVDLNDSTPSDQAEDLAVSPALSTDKTETASNGTDSHSRQAVKPAILTPSNASETVSSSRPIAITAPKDEPAPKVEKSAVGSHQPEIHSESSPNPSGVSKSSPKKSSDLSGPESKSAKPNVPESISSTVPHPSSAPKETLPDMSISPTSEGNKASKTKKKGPARKAELNRKGDQKDGGSDMDAFKDLEKDGGGKPTVDSTLNHEATPPPVVLPAPAATTSTTVTATTTATASPSSLPPLSSSIVPKVEIEEPKISVTSAGPNRATTSQPLPSEKVALTDNNNVSAPKHSNSIPEVITSEPEKESKAHSTMLPPATPNSASSRRSQDDSDIPSVSEDNNVSSNSLDPAITNMLPKTSSSMSKLKYEYKPDQWSPLNPTGSKQYDREFLMMLQNDPLSKQKPQKLPDMDIVKDTSINMSVRKFADNRNQDWTPGYVQATSSRGPMGGISKKGSQNGGKRPDPGKKIISGLSIQEKVELHVAENAWKPDKLRGNKADSDKPAPDSIEELSKRARGILNKLTPQKFETLVEKFNSLPIDTEEKLNLCMELVYEKAVDEPGFSVAYAKMCEVLAGKQVMPMNGKSPIAFRNVLLLRCQKEFMNDYMDKEEKEEFQKQYDAADSEEKRKELKAEFEEKELKARRRSLGNIRFIGELYKLDMLKFKIMHQCIRNLLANKTDEESLECLCRLLSTVGNNLDDETTKTLAKGPNPEIKHFDTYFEDIRKIIGSKQITSRVRFMLQDLLDLRQSKWKPRREAAGPKTIDEIHQDAEREKKLENLMSKNAGGGGGRDDRGWSGRDGRDSQRDSGRGSFAHNDNSRKRNPRASAQGSDEGWNTIQPKFKPDMFNVDFVKNVKKVDATTLHLGGPSRVGASWSQGSLGSRTPRANMPSPGGNRFAAIASLGTSDSGGAPRDDGGSSRTSQSRFGPRDSSPGSNSIDRTEAVKNVQMKRNGPPVSSASDSSADKQSKILKGDPKIDIQIFKPIIDEYLGTNDMKEVLREIGEKFHPSNIAEFVSCVVEYGLERSDGTRTRLGSLFDVLVKQHYLTESQFLKGWCNVLGAVPDLMVDIPKVWDYLALILAPMVRNGTLSLSFLLDSVNYSKPEWKEAPKDFPGLYAAAALHALALNDGHKFVGGMWRKAGLQWSQFIPEADVDDFIATHKLGFSVNDLTVAANGPITQLSADQKRTELLKRLQNPDPKHKDVIYDWIDVTWGNQVSDTNFIRLLTTSVIESSLSSEETKKLDENKVGNLGPIIKRYLDGDVKKEIQAIFALQHLMDQWEHPRQMLYTLFEKFYDQNVLSLEAFLSWKNNEDINEQAGKGVAIKSTTGFFTWLKENEDEDDDEDEDDEDEEEDEIAKNKP
eukprot:TCALIF_06059-PB protein Name:"Similar to Eif4g3 Eukaryotic translation initiation factor 4 gamma 3 (Mus musculus)" AED:0.10 eAED:0.14 QI:762/0.68/0.76/0.88/0.87/0.88/17/1203/1801